LPAGFNSLRAGLSRRKREVWMFDNEIDWVTRLGCEVRSNCREADESGDAKSKRRIHTRPSTSKELQQVESSGKVFK
jgi:hypothetical protein